MRGKEEGTGQEAPVSTRLWRGRMISRVCDYFVAQKTMGSGRILSKLVGCFYPM
jgi:hypothetical protein